MAFIETPRFPIDISYHSSGGPGYHTTITVLRSGHEQRNIDWSVARHRYNAAEGVRSRDQLDTLIAWFHTCEGRAHGFRYKDWADYRSGPLDTKPTPLDQTLGATLGDNTYQLIKTYATGSRTKVRDIVKPVPGTVRIAVGGVEQTTGWTVDTATGIVTFAEAPGEGTITAGYEFDVPVRFDLDELNIVLDVYKHGSAEVPLVEIRL